MQRQGCKLWPSLDLLPWQLRPARPPIPAPILAPQVQHPRGD